MPFRYEQDKSLVGWVLTQRKSHTKNKMPQARKELLNKIGFFVWRAEIADNKMVSSSPTMSSLCTSIHKFILLTVLRFQVSTSGCFSRDQCVASRASLHLFQLLDPLWTIQDPRRDRLFSFSFSCLGFDLFLFFDMQSPQLSSRLNNWTIWNRQGYARIQP